MAKAVNLVNKADALTQLKKNLAEETKKHEAQLKSWETKKVKYDKELDVYRKAVAAAILTEIKDYIKEDENGDIKWSENYYGIQVGFTLGGSNFKKPNNPGAKPINTKIEKINQQIRTISIMAGETFNANLLSDDFFNNI